MASKAGSGTRLRGPTAQKRIILILRKFLPGAVLLCAWEFGAHFLFDADFIGIPSDIIASIASHIQTGKMWFHVGITFREIILGYAIGLLIGGGVGYILGMKPALAAIFEPYIIALNAIPKVAIAPLLIVIFGIGITSKVVIVVSLVFFLMFYNVFVGIRTINVDFLYQVRIMGASRWEEIRFVILPAIMPNIIVGMKTCTVYAVIGAVIGEFIAAHAGLGFFILDASGTFNVTDIWVGVAFLMALVLTMTGLISVAERKLLRWMPRKDIG